MKSTKLLFGAFLGAALTGGMFLTSCGEDETINPLENVVTVDTTINQVYDCTANAPVAIITAPSTTYGTSPIQLSVSSTQTGLTYLWNNGETAASRTINAAGTYAVTVSNSTSLCTGTAQIIITAAGVDCNVSGPQPAINPSVTTLNCSTSTSSMLTASVTGGTAPLTYTWSGGGSGMTKAVTAAGTYTVTVGDSNGCTEVATVAIGGDLTPPAAAVEKSNDLGCGNTEAELTATGGASYLWSNTSDASNILVDVVGTYTVTVTGATGCTTTASATVINAGGDFCTTVVANFDSTYEFPSGGLLSPATWYSIGGELSELSSSFSEFPTGSSGTGYWEMSTSIPAAPDPAAYYGGGFGVNLAEVGVDDTWDLDARDSIAFFVNTGSNAETQLRLRLIDSDGDMMIKAWDLPATNGWTRYAVAVGDLVKDEYQSPAAPASADGDWTDPSMVTDLTFAFHDGDGSGEPEIKAAIDDIMIIRRQ